VSHRTPSRAFAALIAVIKIDTGFLADTIDRLKLCVCDVGQIDHIQDIPQSSLVAELKV
jgi:hypothetical protein